MASKDASPSVTGQARASGESKNRSSKSNITRVRTGCLTCRKRRKKCDERKPMCMNCQKTNVVCEGYPKQVFWDSRTSARKGTNTRGGIGALWANPQNLSVLEETQTHGNEPSYVQWPNSSSSMSSYASPTAFYQEVAPGMEHQIGEELQFFFEQYELPLHVAGDEGFSLVPSSKQPAFNNLQESSSNTIQERIKCQSPQKWILVEHENWMGYNTMPMELPFLISGVESPLHRRLYCHFTKVMSHVLTTSNRDSNPMNSIILPMALHDKNVMDTLLCLAGSHLLKLQIAEDGDELSVERSRLHKQVVRTQQYRIQKLNESVTSSKPIYSDQEMERLFATCLLLCIYEICEGTGDDSWRIFLEMARDILAFCMPSGDPTSKMAPTMDIDPFLLEFFLYHDSLATVTMPSPPTSKPPFPCPKLLSDQDPCVVGVRDGLIDFIFRISSLRSEADSSPRQLDGTIVCKAVEIWEELASWKPNAVLAREEKLIAEFYQWALFIWLFSIVYPDGKEDEKIQSTVQRLVVEMSEIKSGDGVMACLLFPLFVVGSAAITVQDREAVSAHFRRLRAWSSLGNIDLTYRVVEKIWNNHDLGLPRSWDWVKQLQTHGMSLLVT